MERTHCEVIDPETAIFSTGDLIQTRGSELQPAENSFEKGTIPVGNH